MTEIQTLGTEVSQSVGMSGIGLCCRERCVAVRIRRLTLVCLHSLQSSEHVVPSILQAIHCIRVACDGSPTERQSTHQVFFFTILLLYLYIGLRGGPLSISAS